MILPLECDEDGDFRDAAGDIIATVRWPSPDEYELMMARGSAIVRAVNAHEQLLAACKAAEQHIYADIAGDCSYRDIVEQLRTAIAAAEATD